MDVTIQQRKFSLRSEYDIETPACIYLAQKKFLSFRDMVKLFGPREHLLATIKGHFLSFRSKYEFELTDGGVYHFFCKKMWKGVFLCENGKESFRLYQHKGLNYSVFKNENQIAAFTKNRIKVGEGDCYEIRMNGDANLIIIICMTLAIDCSENEDNTATVTVDLGNFGPEERPFDTSWQPS